MIEITPISAVIEVLEILQSELEVMTADEIYEVIDNVIETLIIMEEEQ